MAAASLVPSTSSTMSRRARASYISSMPTSLFVIFSCTLPRREAVGGGGGSDVDIVQEKAGQQREEWLTRSA